MKQNETNLDLAPNETAVTIGQRVAEFLNLKFKDSRTNTSWGTKSIEGLGKCIERIVEEENKLPNGYEALIKQNALLTESKLDLVETLRYINTLIENDDFEPKELNSLQTEVIREIIERLISNQLIK